jgi:hypothetical protein
MFVVASSKFIEGARLLFKNKHEPSMIENRNDGFN